MASSSPLNKAGSGRNAGSTSDGWDLVVIGGGPAGMMAAGRAAERAREEGRAAKILLLEKNDGLGKKLLITGGGRCNVTNAEFDDRKLLARFKDSHKYLFSAFAQHSVAETLEFFHSRNMPTKVENEGRVFPVSDSARSVWDVMVDYLKTSGVIVRSNAEVTGFVQSRPGSIDGVKLRVRRAGAEKTVGVGNKTNTAEEIIRARSFVLATGGKSHPETGSSGDGFAWLAKIGHTVAEPRAALVPVEVADPWVRKLSGFSLPSAKISLYQNGVKQNIGATERKKRSARELPAVGRGKVLFTHFGLSGPAVLNMSSEIGELLTYGEVAISLDLMPAHDHGALNEALQKLFARESRKKFKNALPSLIPAPLVDAVLEKSGIEGDAFCHSVTREERLLLIHVLKDMRMKPTGILGADKAIITSGGVALNEIDWKTMRSRLVPNLSIVGDMLDIDRPSGGYSLQLCWTTGWVAGSHA